MVAVSISAMHIRRFVSSHTRLYGFEISAICADWYIASAVCKEEKRDKSTYSPRFIRIDLMVAMQSLDSFLFFAGLNRRTEIIKLS